MWTNVTAKAVGRALRLRSGWLIGFLLLGVSQIVAAEALIQPQPFLPVTRGEAGATFSTLKATRVELIADRKVYWADELHGQFVALFFGLVKPGEGQQHRIELALSRADGTLVERTELTDVATPKLPILLATHRLEPGQYTLSARLIAPDGQLLTELKRDFIRSAQAVPRQMFPAEGIPLLVHDQPHVADGVWPISTGVPMPKATLREVNELTLLEDGQPVPAQFSVRGTWSPRGYVKWVGVDFLARYRNGKPCSYRLTWSNENPPPAAPLRAQQTDDLITIDTGVMRFTIDRRRFAGLSSVHLGDTALVDRPGGLMVVDQRGMRYEAALDPEAQVELEDVGPLRATVAAHGWYVSAAGEKFCKFVTRLTAHAGQRDVHISHRTILTSTPVYGDERYLADASFAIASAAPLGNWRFGADGTTLPASGGAEASLHQERSSVFRLLREGEPVGAGARSDGWFAGASPRGQIVGYLRDAWQKFPVELSVSADALTYHLWPKHGRAVFSPDEQLARDQIYKVRFAHHGSTLNLLIPDDYHEKLKAFEEAEHWAGGAELVVVRKDGRTKVQIYDGMGAALGAELVVSFQPQPRPDQELAAQAALIQQSPHALADPTWSCATGVLGPVAPRDPARFGPAEHLLDTAYNFYQRSIIDAPDCYGKWIYGGVHSNWEPARHAANLTRVWQQCHYQNVYQSWLLYFRSGLPDHWRWATIHTNQHVDVGVSNYHAYPKGAHSYSHLGDLAGGIYHCKGFVPWGGNSSTMGHWIDIANYFVRYQLTGDRRGLDMAATWRNNLGILGSANKVTYPSTAEGFQSPAKIAEINAWRKANPGAKPAEEPAWFAAELAKPSNFNPREELVPLGELTYFYTSTWDPQILIYLDAHSEYLNTPFRLTQAPSLAHFGKHWQDWYYALSRDERVVQRVEEYLQEQSALREPPRLPSFAAFLYHAAGQERWVREEVTHLYHSTLNVYEHPGDRYHQYSLAHNNPAAMLLGRLPLFLHAAAAAGIDFAPQPDAPSALPTRGGRVDAADKWLTPGRGWSNTGVTVLGYAQAPTPVAVRIDGPMGFGSFRGFYKLYYGWPRLDAMTPRDDLRAWNARQQQDTVTFPNENLFKDPPTQRNFSEGRGETFQALPYVETAANDPQQQCYRLEVGGDAIELPTLLSAASSQPLPQVGVIARTMFWNNQLKPASFRVVGATDLLLRPLDPTAKIQLVLEAIDNRFGMPTLLRLADAQGQEIIRTSVFFVGQRQQVTVELDPAVHPLPWRFISASSGDNRFTFTGAEELFFARSRADFDVVLPKLLEQQQSK